MKRLRNQNRNRKQGSATKLQKQGVLDQFYTRKCIIESLVIPCIKKYMPKGSSYVDFSCGENLIGRMLDEYIGNVIAYDLEPTKEAIDSGAKQKDWFTVTEIPTPCYVGLNPPFGYRGNIAQEFINHTLQISSPVCLFLILPIREWKLEGYEQVERIKLPLDAFIEPNGNVLEYPCHLYVFKQATQQTKPAIATNKKLPSGYSALTHPKTIDMNRVCLLVRRVGYYAGRQFYFIIDGKTYFYHKNVLQENVTWSDNNHNIDNSFWCVYFPRVPINIEQMTSICNLASAWMDNNSLTTRKEDVKRAPSVNKKKLITMLMQSDLIK